MRRKEYDWYRKKRIRRITFYIMEILYYEPEQEHCNIITIQDGKITGTLIPMQKASVGDFTAA